MSVLLRDLSPSTFCLSPRPSISPPPKNRRPPRTTTLPPRTEPLYQNHTTDLRPPVITSLLPSFPLTKATPKKMLRVARTVTARAAGRAHSAGSRAGAFPARYVGGRRLPDCSFLPPTLTHQTPRHVVLYGCSSSSSACRLFGPFCPPPPSACFYCQPALDGGGLPLGLGRRGHCGQRRVSGWVGGSVKERQARLPSHRILTHPPTTQQKESHHPRSLLAPRPPGHAAPPPPRPGNRPRHRHLGPLQRVRAPEQNRQGRTYRKDGEDACLSLFVSPTYLPPYANLPSSLPFLPHTHPLTSLHRPSFLFPPTHPTHSPLPPGRAPPFPAGQALGRRGLSQPHWRGGRL